MSKSKREEKTQKVMQLMAEQWRLLDHWGNRFQDLDASGYHTQKDVITSPSTDCSSVSDHNRLDV